MTKISWIPDGCPGVIGAFHLPPFPGSQHPSAQPVSVAVDHALRNIEKAVKAGVPAIYLQDLGDTPVATSIQPHAAAALAVVGTAVRREFPDLALGICMMSHGCKEPLAIAQAIGAQFVRLKVYVGVMVKAEGVLEGLAYEAIQYRAQLHAKDVEILADIYDRTGKPLGRMPLEEEARWAAVHCRADGLILTGSNFDESMQMLSEVKAAALGVPLLLGGGANTENVKEVFRIADGVIVSSAFKALAGWTRESMLAEWEYERIQAFMDAVR
ncbi:MAG: BtpA/SgcQ family protein [Anaerolineaceae bacterium]|jgi:membrane complex biogenesis BtpA family protein|nr:BtpA/SgcQ family protein [Anaerolineaceae bacterium]